jgi:hypothetical protein
MTHQIKENELVDMLRPRDRAEAHVGFDGTIVKEEGT